MADRTKRIRLFNIELDNLTMGEAVEKVSEYLKTGRFHHIVTPNAARISCMARDEELMEIYKKAELVVADGISIALSSVLLARPIKERITGADLLPRILDLAARLGYRVFILKGTKQDIGLEIRKRLLKRFPGLPIAGMYFPPYDFNIEKDMQENEKILKEIQKDSVDMLIVSLGSPKGERWIWRNRNFLKDTPICMEIGVAIDYVTNRVRRAPRWMQVIGSEWLFRFCCEPRRLWKRCLLGNTFFLWVLVKEFFSTVKQKKK